ncbi:hypothetical protein [Nocardia cyriacigeorgica]|uniref:hypothetical protein n=1 Tax=Nocardia cyriacigeorgica TaxID=135487 RepID=UPI001C49B96A|nr:hypothetical protein [Nocardia cyriacigeorgica]BDU08022.1 hypothetical protein FMUBM48_42850 [Nocardia cyriacigeorgica]
MGAITQQLLTLLGVVVGAAATFSATVLTERAKWRRTLDTRWDDKRLTAYFEYANALKKYATLCHRLAAARGYRTATQPIDLEEGIAALAEADAEKAIKWEQVLLLGSPGAVAAARRWTEAVWRLSHIARGHAVDQFAYTDLYEEAGRRRNQFYELARADLGVTSGELPPGDVAWLEPAELGIETR